MTYEAVAAQLAAEVVKRYTTSFLDAVHRKFKIEIKKFKADQQAGIARFYEHQLERYSSIKTIIPSDKPLRLEDIYVDQRLSIAGSQLSEAELMASLVPKAKFLISGVAGSGKSLLLRRFLLKFANRETNVIPLFLELRHLKTMGTGIVEQLVASMAAHVEWVDEQMFVHLLKTGNVLLLLDGLDEVESEIRDSVVQQIRQLIDHYPENIFVVSTRPEKSFWYFSDFTTTRLLDFNQEQLMLLLDRVPAENFAKDKFRGALSSDLYERHRSFLTNPLLAIMMLLSFSKNGNVPDEFHAFYQQAFEVLFNQHDATKELYERTRYTKLTGEDFKRLLARFSIKTYSDSRYSFRADTLFSDLGAAARFCSLPIEDPRPVVEDLVESLCFLQKDGLEYTFTHRSFQEYFAARFLAIDNPLNIKKVCDYLATQRYQDAVLPMLFEMSVQNVERQWVLPWLDAIVDRFDKRDPTDTQRYVAECYDYFEIDGAGFHFAPEGDKKLNLVKIALQRMYSDRENLQFLNPWISGELEFGIAKTLERLRPRGVRAVKAGYGAIRNEDIVVLRIDMQERSLYQDYFLKTQLPEMCVKDKQSFQTLRDRVHQRVRRRDEDLSSMFE